jgi:hypothetical protein
MTGGHSGGVVDRGRDGTRRGASLGGPRCPLAFILLTLAVAGCSSISTTPSMSPTPTGRTTAPPPSVTAATVPGFRATGSMVSQSRGYHTATLLPDGRVLIVGGQTVVPGSVTLFASAELYDPATSVFSPTGSMAEARESHTATLLQDGRVLIVGGQNDQVLASAELYDPKTGRFSATGVMVAPRENHTATLLADGRVLIAGGNGPGMDQAPVASAEIYDPASGTFSPTGSMVVARNRAGATLLADGRVLIAGGEDAQFNPVATVEIYDPKTGRFSSAGSMQVGTFAPAEVITLRDGRVFLAGADGHGYTAQRFDPTSGSFSPAGRMAVQALDTAVLLHDGRVLVLGGHLPGGSGNGSADLYDPTTNTFGPAGTMTSPRLGQSATVLADGQVLVAGGADDASAEVYTPPAPGATITPAPTPTLEVPAQLAGLPVTNVAADQIHRSPAYASTAFGALVYTVAGKGQAIAEVTVSDLSTGGTRTTDVRLPAGETVPDDPTQQYAATDGHYLVLYGTHPAAAQSGSAGIGGCVASGGDWQLLVAPLDPATGLPSGDFTVFASGVMKRVFNAPRAGEGGSCWYQNTVFAVDAGMIAYTIDDVTSARPMGSRILVRSLADGSTLRSVAATEMVYELDLSGTTIAWAECQNISLTDQPEQVKVRVSTAANPTPLDIASGPVSPSGGDGRELPAIRLAGDEVSWEGLGNTSVWYQKIGEGSPLSLTPPDLACQLAGSTPGYVAVFCTWNGTGGIPERSSLLIATIGAGLRQVQGLPTDAALRPIVSNGWFVDSGGQLAYQPVANTYGVPVAALGM